jgi:hypothetical protein
MSVMDPFTDYYTVLGVDIDAPASAIKVAFKKLALQYHPDVYKGEDAHERMSSLLLAYQTLNDPVMRKQYDMLRSERLSDGRASRAGNSQRSTVRPSSAAGSPPRYPRSSSAVPSPAARRDTRRYYDFPDLRNGQPAYVDLIKVQYTLTADEVRNLREQGILRDVQAKTENNEYYCHRCQHSWSGPAVRRRNEKDDTPRSCPSCRATDWSESLLLRCIHCCAVFESEQIRYEIGSYTYGKRNVSDLCPPYELFPLCPYCGTARWCPAEDTRVELLRQQAERRAAAVRLMWIIVVLIIIVLLGVVSLATLR